MNQDKGRTTLTSQRVRSYWLLVAGTVVTAYLIMSVAGKDLGGVGAGGFFIVSMGAMLFGYLGIVVGCVIEQRRKEFAFWLVVGLLVVLMMVYIWFESS